MYIFVILVVIKRVRVLCGMSLKISCGDRRDLISRSRLARAREGVDDAARLRCSMRCGHKTECGLKLNIGDLARVGRDVHGTWEQDEEGDGDEREGERGAAVVHLGDVVLGREFRRALREDDVNGPR